MRIELERARHSRHRCCAGWCLALFCAGAAAASAATITVTSTADHGAGTLRAALASAANGDLISFSVAGTITLTSGELSVARNVTIAGPGPSALAVNGNVTNRVFHVGPGANVVISGLTIANGYASGGSIQTGSGGGVLNERATLTVSNCTVSANSSGLGGGGIANIAVSGTATLAVVNSLLVSNVADLSNVFEGGGGINNTGDGGSATVIVVNSVLMGNSCFAGPGGIANLGLEAAGRAMLTLTNCSLIGNRGDQGGGVWNDGESGGDASVLVVNSTLSGNSASGGGILQSAFPGGSASVVLRNSTLSGNSSPGGPGGGIKNENDGGSSATVRIFNSTLSGNWGLGSGGAVLNAGYSGPASLETGSTIFSAGISGGTISNLSGTVTSLGYNLSSDDGGGVLTDGTDQINTDPLLGPLQTNGGPTSTHLLIAGSPALDQGTNFSASAEDQRGFPRTSIIPGIAIPPGGDGTDVGAVEDVVPPVQLTLTADGGGGYFIRFIGIVGSSYRLQRATGLAGPWLTSAPQTAPASGLVEFHDLFPPTAQAFYRSVQP